MRVGLFTGTDRKFVAEVVTLPWEKWPEGIQWGARTFFLQKDIFTANSDGFAVPLYLEGLLWWSPVDKEQ
jgi:hypothetical protein